MAILCLNLGTCFLDSVTQGHTALHNFSLLCHFPHVRLPQVLVATFYTLGHTTALPAEHSFASSFPALLFPGFPTQCPSSPPSNQNVGPFPTDMLVAMLLIPWPQWLSCSLNISPARKLLQDFPCTLSLFIDLHITSSVLWFFALAATFRTVVEPNKHLLNGLTMYPLSWTSENSPQTLVLFQPFSDCLFHLVLRTTMSISVQPSHRCLRSGVKSGTLASSNTSVEWNEAFHTHQPFFTRLLASRFQLHTHFEEEWFSP